MSDPVGGDGGRTQAVLHRTQALSRRLEGAQADGARRFVTACRRLTAESPGVWLEVAGGVAVYAGPDSPMNGAVGLGLSGPVSADDVARLREFFHSRGEAAVVEVSPFADSSLLKRLAHDGFRLNECKMRWLADPNSMASAEPAPGPVTVEECADRDLWPAVVARGFNDGRPLEASDLDLARGFAAMDGVVLFLGRVNGEPAGGGALDAASGIAAMFAGSVLPAFRGRGVQSALVAARLAWARRHDVSWVTVETDPASISQRTMERAGFALAYAKAVLRRPSERGEG